MLDGDADVQPHRSLASLATAFLVLSTIPMGWYGAHNNTPLGQSITNSHKAIGVAILALTFARIIWRLGHRPPAFDARISRWERLAASSVHMGFYLLLVLLPLTGWWMSSASPMRHPIGWEGIFEIPFLPIEQAGSTAKMMHFIHFRLAWLMMLLAALHIAAALKHQLIQRDGLFDRIWIPIWKGGSSKTGYGQLETGTSKSDPGMVEQEQL